MIKGSPDRALPEVRVNDTIMLRTQLPGMENRIELSGNVRNMQRDSQRISMGIQFNDMDEEKKMRVIDYISTLEEVRLGKIDLAGAKKDDPSRQIPHTQNEAGLFSDHPAAPGYPVTGPSPADL